MASQARIIGQGTTKVSCINGVSLALPNVQKTDVGYDVDFNEIHDTQVSIGDGILYLANGDVRTALVTGLTPVQGPKRVIGLRCLSIDDIPQAVIDASQWDQSHYHQQELILTDQEVTVPLQNVLAR